MTTIAVLAAETNIDEAAVPTAVWGLGTLAILLGLLLITLAFGRGRPHT